MGSSVWKRGATTWKVLSGKQEYTEGTGEVWDEKEE